jgi:Uma2 family endonuclease
MATIAPPEQRVLMHNISWETYERLLRENVGNPGTRFTYDEGELEIMVVSIGHERPNRTLGLIAEVTAEDTEVESCATGSTTFKRIDLLKGFEPDSSYYFRNASDVRGKDELNLRWDPPPELVIEVDITRSSLDRFPIFAAVGVLEIWRYDGERVTFHQLKDGAYVSIEESAVLPPMTASQATAFVERYSRESSLAWKRSLRAWIRSRL